MKLQYINKFSY